MAEAVNSDPTLPAPKRRRILNLSAVVPVPIYSNKVSSGLRLKPAPSTMSKHTASVVDTSSVPPGPPLTAISYSDSEEEEEEEKQAEEERSERTFCPSPPPPVSPVQRQSRCVRRKISELDRKLRAVSSLLSPEPQTSRTRRRCTAAGGDDVIISSQDNDDDVTIVTPPEVAVGSSPYIREFPLKVRCRTDVHKICVQSSTRLADVVTQLASILDVPRPRLLLMREEAELPIDATVQELGLCIADIIECVVTAAEGGAKDSITVKLQSNDRDSSHHFTVNKDAPLGPVFTQYLSKVARGSRRAPTFLFDGIQLSPQQSPAQLDMEDDDIIQVWF